MDPHDNNNLVQGMGPQIQPIPHSMGMTSRREHGGGGHWQERAPAEGGGGESTRGELSESSVLTSPPASDVLQNALGDLTSPANFPAAADHCCCRSPSTCEDFSCLLGCWHSCLALSSPSLHTSLWRKPYSSEGVHCCLPAPGRGVILVLSTIAWRRILIDKLFLSSNTPWIIDPKNRTKTQKRICQLCHARKKILLRLFALRKH